LISGIDSEFSLLHSIHTGSAFRFTQKLLFQTLFSLIKCSELRAAELEM